jgi:CHAT domain-containing protein
MLRFSRNRILALTLGFTIISVGFCLYRFLHRGDRADELLEKADDLAWNNEWMEAAPLYRQAESLYIGERRPSEALYAHVSQFIPRADSEPIPSLLVELEKDESLSAAKPAETHLRILVIEGMIETNYDASMARRTWGQIESIAWRQGHVLLVARAMGEQGIAAFLLGDIATAGKLVRIAWIAAKVFHDPAAHVRYASIYGAGLVELQHYNRALKALDEAIDTATHSRGVAYPSIAVNSKIDALRGLHRYGEALAVSEAAIRRLPNTSLDAHLFQIFTSQGEVYGDLNQWNHAEAVYSRALGYARHLQYWRGIAQTGGLLAEAFEHTGQLDDALVAVNEAIHANEQVPAELYFVPRNLAIKAEILDKLGQPKTAHALYEKSLTLIDSLVATAQTPEVERDLLTQLSLVYTGYFRSLVNEGNLPGAFEVVEGARGRIEAQALQDHPLVLPHEPSSTEQRIVNLNIRLLETDDPATKGQLDQALKDAGLANDEAMLAAYTARTPLSLRSVQQHLKPGELLLEYVLAEPVSWVLAVTDHSASRYDIPGKSEIDRCTQQYASLIHERKTDPTLAAELFQKLLAPVPEYRANSSIIVIPDGQLHLLPFAALVDKDAYVVMDHAVTVSPSATVLSLLRDRERSTLRDPLDYVGVAAWSDDKGQTNNAVQRTAFGAPSRPLDLLPESKTEVENIARDFPRSSTVLLGASATETKFKQLPLVDYRVLHLALHGYADLAFPDRSALVFAPEPGGQDDGLLEIREIRRLRLKAHLVTLSACNTGVGRIGASDIANMGNAFIEAGAETVVSTLWEQEDRTTEQLMTDFYQKLASHEGKVTALRGAQLDQMQAGLSPYYWAGFEMIGDPSGTL